MKRKTKAAKKPKPKLVTRTVLVTIPVEVTFDESKFTNEFFRDFRREFYNLVTLDEHAEHLAQMYARDVHGGDDFIDGYGETSEMGIRMKIMHRQVDTEVTRVKKAEAY